ncbi:CAP domain-containing protein [Sphingomonas solaris]|uniref:SCP-like extracellular n=1 Tax=Alterirhizorhabdus solaris TaxID=2529389 RepID=A0A558QXZ8_9SPHN|nr:CAP domain-containing protein [Sphingomonas solaris]TVV71969.1 SCP-like extracellular [Sphingomonas solaris]
MTSILGKGKLVASALLLACLPIVTGSLGHRTDFEARILAAHNRERAALGIPPLRWNEDLANGAKDWSDHLALTGGFAHSPNEPGQDLEGENIWGGTPKAFSPEAMVTYWIAEKRYFRDGVFPRNSRTGNVADVSHYTQVMWRSTRQVGCSLSNGRREEILVCRYSDPGNIIGRVAF